MQIQTLILVLFTIFTLFVGCNTSKEKTLPILGIPKIENGDTIKPTIRDFSFLNQDSTIITNDSYQGKMYISDFFFTSCPTICPVIKREMLKIHKHFKDEPRVMFLSHTIDIKHDTIPALKEYAEKLGVDASFWSFVTGEKEDIYSISKDYLNVALEDESLPGGFDHTGNIILVDDNRHVRAFCNGTDSEDVNDFIKDIELLIKEYDQRSK